MHDQRLLLCLEECASVRKGSEKLHAKCLVRRHVARCSFETDAVRKLIDRDQRNDGAVGASDEVHQAWLMRLLVSRAQSRLHVCHLLVVYWLGRHTRCIACNVRAAHDSRAIDDSINK